LYNFFPEINAVQPNNTKGEYFLFYGRLSAEKGIFTLLKAWEKADISSVLKIVGDGPLKEDILKFIIDNQLKNIQYLGFKNKNELPDLISNSSFIIIPSEWYENNPLTIVESYTYSKPVIGSEVGGIPEIIDNKNTGYLFEMGNSDLLAEVIKAANSLSEQDYINLSNNARTFAEKHFSPEEHYKKLIKIYQTNINNYY
jgi:glycosyltransferase involved in cell wall biosynthesis